MPIKALHKRSSDHIHGGVFEDENKLGLKDSLQKKVHYTIYDIYYNYYLSI